MKHSLFSHDKDMAIAFFEEFNKEDIREQVISHLKEFPEDILEHCREYNKENIMKYYGFQIVNHYGVNPKTNKVSLIVTRGNKEYFKSIEQ